MQSRAYITFKKPDALVAFSRGYDGWSFRDKAGALARSFASSDCSDRSTTTTGNISQAVVEFAPYQRIPTAPAKADPREGTIDAGEPSHRLLCLCELTLSSYSTDPDFLAFQEALSAAPVATQPVETRSSLSLGGFPCHQLTWMNAAAAVDRKSVV